MKKFPATILFISSFILIFQTVEAKSIISGKLLKSNGKPLAYTEIELIPIEADEIIIDPRLYAVSSAAGNFSFPNVPNGSYTLSINFEDSPTELSPYARNFFPNTANRDNAKIFEIVDNTKVTNLSFQLPPAMTKRNVSGKVLWKTGKPAIGILILIRDVTTDEDNYASTNLKTDATGNFTKSLFENRKYQILAIALNAPLPAGIPYARAKSDIFLLDQKTTSFNLTLEDLTKPDKKIGNDVGIFRQEKID
jgi:hypothetical protein